MTEYYYVGQRILNGGQVMWDSDQYDHIMCEILTKGYYLDWVILRENIYVTHIILITDK